MEHFVDTSQHFGGCPAGKGEQQDPRRINSFVNQVRHTMNERPRLAGTRAGNQQQRILAMQNGFPLFGIQSFEQVV